MNPRDPGSLEAAIARAYEQVGGIKDAAYLLERSDSQLYAYASATDPAAMPLPLAARLCSLGGTSLAEHLAALCGGTFRPEAAAAENASVIALAGEAVREAGEAVSSAIAAAADGSLTEAERAKVADEADHAISAFTKLRSAMGAGLAKASRRPRR